MAKKAPATALTKDTRVAVLHGPERFLQDLYTQKLKEALGAAFGDVEAIRFDGESAALADVLDECRSFGLMQQHKLIVVDNADRLVKDDDEESGGGGGGGGKGRGGGIRRSNREILIAYCDAPSEQATLLLRCDRWYPGNLDKAIAKVGAVTKCERPDPEQATSWAVERCKRRHASSIEPAAAALLVDHLGSDLGRIDSELGKLALVRPGQPITVDQVREMVGVTREEELWSIQSQLVTGDPADGLRRLRDLIEISREDPVPITYAYLDLARKLHGVARGLKQGENPMNLQKRYKLWGPSAEVVMRAARRVSIPAAARLLSAAVETDQRQKSSAGDAVLALEVLTLRFASLLAAAGR